MDDYLPADASALMNRIREGLCDPRIKAWVQALAKAVLDEHPPEPLTTNPSQE